MVRVYCTVYLCTAQHSTAHARHVVVVYLLTAVSVTTRYCVSTYMVIFSLFSLSLSAIQMTHSYLRLHLHLQTADCINAEQVKPRYMYHNTVYVYSSRVTKTIG